MNQIQMLARYNELLARYQDVRPQDRVCGPGRDPLVEELDAIECQMLDNPPAGCRKGLVLPGEMEKPKGVPMLASLTLEDMDIKVLSESEAMDIISDPDRTPPDHYVRKIINQGQVGLCASAAAVGARACRFNQDGEDSPELNPSAVYNTTSGGSDRGSTLHDNLAYMQEFGCPSVEAWPHSKSWRTKPSNEAMQDALNNRIAKDGVVKVRNRMEFITMALAGYPIQFGYPGHSIFGDDILDLTRLDYTNSWDITWGNEGHGTLSFDRIYWPYGAYAVIAARGKN